MGLQARHKNLATFHTTLAPLVTRWFKAGIRFSATRLLEITAWVLVTAWCLAFAVWVWGNFMPWATMP